VEVGGSCRIGCQGPSEERACIAGNAVRVRLGLFCPLPNRGKSGSLSGTWRFRIRADLFPWMSSQSPSSLLSKPHRIIIRRRCQESGRHSRI
jgi:hypothetical protein